MSEAIHTPEIAAPPPTIDLSFSPTIGKLASALAKAHKKFKPVKKTSNNPFFHSKYADLAEVLDATAEGLSDNDLAVIQSPGLVDGKIQLTTVLAHSSGEWMQSVLHMPVSKPDAQGVGSAITYARRYAYSAIVNVASEQDDDGNAASAPADRRGEETTEAFDQRTEGQRRIAQFQVAAFNDACKRTGKSSSQIQIHLQGIGIGQVEEMTREQFQDSVKWANAKTEDLAPKLRESVAKAEKGNKFSFVFAAAKRHGVPEADWRRSMKEIYGCEHLTEMTAENLKSLVSWIEEQ